MALNAVNAVLNSHWDGRLPVRPDLIAHRMGIEVRPLTPSFDGSAPCGVAEITSDGRRVIYYNGQEPHSRIRFTLAHELGHHILGHTQQGRMYRDFSNPAWNDNNSIEEKDANRFSAELLMPDEAVNTLINRDKIYSIPDLAARFDVSQEAMYWRMKNLGYL